MSNLSKFSAGVCNSSITMYSGYADIAAYHSQMTSDDGFHSSPMYELFPALPIELTPSYELRNPWISGATFEEDFILIAEFSEVEGPKPLVSYYT